MEDSGRGIPSDRLARAFEAFSQLHDGQVREGSGLGLAVSKRFVEMHGGRMWIESRAGQGTTVGFALPILRGGDDVQATPRRDPAWTGSQDRHPAVLVLHDDPRALAVLQRHIEDYRFVQAGTVGAARQVAQNEFPVAVVADASWTAQYAPTAADLGLPGDTPFVTCPLPSLRRLGLLMGAADYLGKPVLRDDLNAALARLPSPPRRALVVDDDAHVVRLLARLLKACRPELEVVEAFGGKVGLEVARSQRPDLVLLDLLMPEVNGYQFLDEMNRDPDLAGVQAIIVSARSVDWEATPMQGEFRLGRGGGLGLAEILQTLQVVLPVITRRPSAVRASAVARREGRPGAPAW